MGEGYHAGRRRVSGEPKRCIFGDSSFANGGSRSLLAMHTIGKLQRSITIGVRIA